MAWAHRERDRLGGHDPYSASKAGAELVAGNYRSAFLQQPSAPLLATARGGNLIGGGDWSADRLIPDAVRSLAARRSPLATRPWLHVLDCLSGYLVLGQRLLEGDITCPNAWNFGPDGEVNRTVELVLEVLARTWSQLRRQVAPSSLPHAAGLFLLDSAKAKMHLGWRPVWNIERAVHHTADFYRQWLELGAVPSADQLDVYVADAAASDLAWATA
jgi:CDP-glucose 4,6-dehydratase